MSPTPLEPSKKRYGLRCLPARWLSSAAYALFLGPALLVTNIAPAQESPRDREIREKSQIFNPRASFDTTPVTVKVVSVTYRIPRNYLTHMEPTIPTLVTTFPGFKPLTKETQDCFDPKWRFRNQSCTVIEFRLLGSGGPGPGGRALTNAEKFENSIKKNSIRDRLAPREGPFGYQLYQEGPEEARREIYRKIDGDIYFGCNSAIGKDGRKKYELCNDMFRLDDMNHVQFYFSPRLIEHIPEIEVSIRRLMASFVTQGGK